MDPTVIPDEIYMIIDSLKKVNASAYLVGGSVRDLLLNQQPDEYDFEIFADQQLKTIYKHSSPEDKELILENFIQDVIYVLSTFSEIKKVGRSFGVFKMEKKPYDFSFPRAEKKTGETRRDYHIVLNPFLDYYSAQKRRDITINSLLYSLDTGSIIDHFGGQSDLKKQIIRHVDPETFIEDPLRVYRIAQFCSRFGFSVAPETIRLSRQVDFSKLSLERIDIEYEKLLEGLYPEKGLEFLFVANVLEKNHPELLEMVTKTENVFKDGYFSQLQKMEDHSEKLALFLLFLKNEEWSFFIKRSEKILRGITAHTKLIHKVLDYFFVLQIFEDFYKQNIEKAEVVWELSHKKDRVNKNLIDEYVKLHAGYNNKLLQETEKLYQLIMNFNSLINGEDLKKIGIQPSEQFKEYLLTACKWQIEGYNKEEIIGKMLTLTKMKKG